MVVRKRKRKNKLRGQRTHGGGDKKNRRGAGCRGGRGRAGSHKHKYSKYYMVFGTEKKSVRAQGIVRAININQLVQRIPQWLADGRVERKGGALIVDGRKILFDKLLSRGDIAEKIVVFNMSASGKAREKVAAAGGSVEEPGAEKPEGQNLEGEEKE